MTNQVQGGASEVFALVILTLAFLWIAAVGSSRVLKVLDRRNYLLGSISQQQQRSALYGGTLQQPPHTHHQYQQQQIGGSLLRTPRQSATGTNSSSYRASSSSAAAGAGVYGSTFTDNLICDNRFVFGFFAVILGVGRAAYLIAFLFLSGGNGGTISGDNVLADTVTAPLAWSFYSLLAAILWTLRDLLDRVKSLMINVSAAAADNRSHHTSSPLPCSPERDDAENGDASLTTATATRAATTTTTPPSSRRPNQQSDATRGFGRNPDTVGSFATVGTGVSMATKLNQNDSREDHCDDNDDKDDDDEIEEQHVLQCQQRQQQDHHRQEAAATRVLPICDNSEDELATPVRHLTSPSRLSNNNNNNNNNSKIDNSQKIFSLVEVFECLRPFRAPFTIALMFCIIAASVIGSWVQHLNSHEDAAKLQPAIVSSVISFCLMLWSIYSSVESIIVMRRIGIAAHRVAIAIGVMAIFLLVRGMLILPPVQSQMCGETDGEDGTSSFWRCSFTYNFIDCAGIALILQILP